MTEYMTKFDKFLIRYDLRENLVQTLSRFKNNLEHEIQREIMFCTIDTLELGYQKAYEVKYDLKYIVKRFVPYTSSQPMPKSRRP